MNAYFIEDLNDIARSAMEDYSYETKCLHRLYNELKVTVCRKHQRLVVTGAFPEGVVQIIKSQGVSVASEVSDGVSKTILFGWDYVYGPDRIIAVESMFEPIPTTTLQENPATDIVDELD